MIASPPPSSASTEPIFVPEYWNPPSRIELARRTGFDIESSMASASEVYTMFLLGLTWFTPGYIEQVWNLAVLRGGLIYGKPLEELLSDFRLGRYWTGV